LCIATRKLRYFAAVPLILTIDTAVAEASVCLAEGASILGLQKAAHQMESAAWIHGAIQQLLQEHGIAITQLDAVAVSAGPGSYTGLRIGLATAKGLCFALNRALITINTLQMMAAAAAAEPTALLCPMIDARRMEVFTALYTRDGSERMPAQALVLAPGSFVGALENETITFFGNGSEKFQKLLQHQNAFFKSITADASHLVPLAHHAFLKKTFADLAYSEPFYGKAFFSPAHEH
jgi:tRNA threonylcarbamoyladenosine biosynthesis protein TsaB